MPEIRELYQGYCIKEMKMNYSAANHVKGREIMVFCPALAARIDAKADKAILA